MRRLTPNDYERVAKVIEMKIEMRKSIQGKGEVLTGEKFNITDIVFNLADKLYFKLDRYPIDVAIPSMQYLKFRQILLQITGMAMYNKGSERIKAIFHYILNIKELDQHDHMIYLPFEWFQNIAFKLVDRKR